MCGRWAGTGALRPAASLSSPPAQFLKFSGLVFSDVVYLQVDELACRFRATLQPGM